MPTACPISRARRSSWVTEDTYPPLQFVDPASGKATGWEYDAMNAIA